MSNALAISGVTAVLQYCLTQIYNSTSALPSVKVTAVAPDLCTAGSTTDNSALQVNVFMHQVTFNAAWRNAGMPSLGADGATRLKNPPVALDLQYLLTAYAAEDTQAEALLGYAIQMLLENPVLPRDEIRKALNSMTATNPLGSAITTTGLADQIELIKITPATLGREEIAWLWTALKSDYRPTFPFQISVVLIEPPSQTSFALPVLSRNIGAQGGPLAGLAAGLPARVLAVQPPAGQTASAPGDTVTVSGQNLSAASQVALTNQRLGLRYAPFALASSAVTAASVSFTVPEDPANLPAGLYNFWLIFKDSGGTTVGTTNILPLAIAPRILTLSASAALVTVTCDPQVLPNQSVSLSLAGAMAGTAVPAQPFATATATLTFQFPALAAGSYVAQLKVDGVDSPIDIQWTPLPPTFKGPFLEVPAA
jgi:hypothetical protein